MKRELWMVLDISPEPWAVGPVGYARHSGKMSAYIGRNQQLNAYEEAVAEAVQEQWMGLPVLTGKIKLRLYFWRNQATYKTTQARQHRKHEADATNMQKATEDALQGVLYANDKDNLDVQSIVMAQGPDVVGKVVIYLEVIDPDTHMSEVYADLPPDVRKAIELIDTDNTASRQMPEFADDYGDGIESF